MTYSERAGTERTVYFGVRTSAGSKPAVELGDMVLYYQSDGDTKIRIEKAEPARFAQLYHGLVDGGLLFFGFGKCAEIRHHATGHVDIMIRSIVPDLDGRIL